jgi:hypothetical protein
MLSEDALLDRYERLADEGVELLAAADNLSQKQLRDRITILSLTLDLLELQAEIRRRVRDLGEVAKRDPKRNPKRQRELR